MLTVGGFGLVDDQRARRVEGVVAVDGEQFALAFGHGRGFRRSTRRTISRPVSEVNVV
jgi:hypothetical protein